MNTALKVDAIVDVLSPISHIGEVVGVEAPFNRIKVIQPDGNVEYVPIISGNSVRGILRDSAMLHMLEVLRSAAGDFKLTLDAFYALFSGGALNRPSSALKLDFVERLRNLVPPVSVFGTALGNYILPGKLRCGMVVPIAREAKPLLPQHLYEAATASVFDLMDTSAYTRFDDAKRGSLQAWLQDGAFADREAPQQMRYQVETLTAGAQLYWSFALEGANDIEVQAFVAALYAWGQNPRLGGKSSIGHGSVRVQFENGWVVDGSQTALPSVDDYLYHLRAQAGEIVDVLAAI